MATTFHAGSVHLTVPSDRAMAALRRLGFDPRTADDDCWTRPTEGMVHAEGDRLEGPDLLARACIAGRPPAWIVGLAHQAIAQRSVIVFAHEDARSPD